MALVDVAHDELYPYFVFDVEQSEWYDRELELTSDEVTDLERVSAEWEAWQVRLSKATRKQKPALGPERSVP